MFKLLLSTVEYRSQVGVSQSSFLLRVSGQSDRLPVVLIHFAVVTTK